MYYKTFVCFGNKGACDVKQVRNRRHAFSLSYGVLDVTQNTGMGYVVVVAVDAGTEHIVFLVLLIVVKEGKRR